MSYTYLNEIPDLNINLIYKTEQLYLVIHSNKHSNRVFNMDPRSKIILTTQLNDLKSLLNYGNHLTVKFKSQQTLLQIPSLREEL